MSCSVAALTLDLELKVPVTRDTVFRLASMSKQIIATGVMQLVADGKLRLDDRVFSYRKIVLRVGAPSQGHVLLLHGGKDQSRD
jgi:CubicO group peptidase (beta-lactamase class C family)